MYEAGASQRESNRATLRPEMPLRRRRASAAAVLLVFVAAASAAGPNLRPIIGVVANGPNDTSILPPYDSHDAYIAASYVKHIEGAGGRAVPIPWFLPADEVRALAKSLNGFILPGGGTHFFLPNGSLSGYGATTKILFDETVAAWAAGESVPLWGTCLGHEMTLTHAANDSRTIDKFGYVAENVSYPISLTASGAASRLWGSAPAEVLEAITQWNVTINLHEYGISSADFNASPAAQLLAILSTNVDANGKEFVSSTEGLGGLPIFTTQFHPEKPTFEWWATEQVNHTYASIVANQWTARFFVNEARKNARAFPSEDAENDALIWNWSPEYTIRVMKGYAQTYFFDRATFAFGPAATAAMKAAAAAAAAQRRTPA